MGFIRLFVQGVLANRFPLASNKYAMQLILTDPPAPFALKIFTPPHCTYIKTVPVLTDESGDPRDMRVHWASDIYRKFSPVRYKFTKN